MRGQDSPEFNQETRERIGLKLTSPFSQADWGELEEAQRGQDVGISPWAWPAQEQAEEKRVRIAGATSNSQVVSTCHVSDATWTVEFCRLSDSYIIDSPGGNRPK